MGKIKTSSKLLLITNILSVVVIIVLSVTVITNKTNKENMTITHDKNDHYLLTNPILDCEVASNEGSLIVFSKDVNEKTNEIKDKYSLDHISLYFRDLNNGPWVGIDEKEVFSPASLLKVPIFIAFLKEAENNPAILDKKVKISESDINKSFHQNIVSSNTLVAGQEYSLFDISKYMIIESDNTAVSILLNNINPDNIKGVFESVGVPYKDTSTEIDLGIKDYAGFFRVLYNSSYLNREMSEKALEVLSQGDYKDGLVAGVPAGTIVSHKFGERSIPNQNDSTQLHDCGIIYYPNNPYLLCIMTRGNDLASQGKATKELSSYIYNQVDKNKVKN